MNKEQILFFPEIPTYAWFSEGPDEYHRDANNCDPYYNISFESSFKKEVVSAFSLLLNSDRSCSGIRFTVSPVQEGYPRYADFETWPEYFEEDIINFKILEVIYSEQRHNLEVEVDWETRKMTILGDRFRLLDLFRIVYYPLIYLTLSSTERIDVVDKNKSENAKTVKALVGWRTVDGSQWYMK